MSILGEAVLTASVELLIKKLTSSELLSFARQEQIHADLKKWENILTKIYAVLDDAEDKQITNRFVKNWLVDLQNLAYDVEDILDEFETVALERKLLHQPAEAGTSKVRKLIPTCCTQFNPHTVKFNVKMRSQIKEITASLEDIAAQKSKLDLTERLEGRSDRVKDQRLPTTSLSEVHVYGREKDQEAIIELLLKDEGKEDGISVIPIVGMGGLGKTTLAQHIYNDVRVKSHFDLKGWVCVSDDFDVIRVTRTILQSIAPGTSDFNDLNQLQVELNKILSKKKFLIVLDDIWNENYDKWMILLRPFKVGSSGSKIIVTTRSNYISSMVGSLPTHHLEVLSYDDCLSIFTHHSIGRKDFDGHQDLKDIGEKIVRKCKGLPLAAKILGGLLHNNVNCDDWKRVLNSKIWNLPEERSDILPALKLSYYYLPSHLKRCFAYCSLVPKDYVFKKEEIIMLWMAQGFLQQESSEMQMEDLGDDYFRELQSRSFFQQSSNYPSRYVMHDLINDLAQWIAGEIFFFRMENTIEGNKQNNISKNLRHLSFPMGQYDGIKRFAAFYGVNDLCNLTYNGGLHDGVNRYDAFNGFKRLRTFLPFMPQHLFDGTLSRDIVNMLPKLQCLRVLSLKEYDIKNLPDTIGDLKYLRYLDLSYTPIHVLPESISNLYNLLTLKLDCVNLRKLCPDIGNLINLRHLSTYGVRLEGMPLRFGKLTGLRLLSDFAVGKNTGSQLKELKFLKHLQGALRISGLQNVNDANDAKEADLCGKRNLNKLSLEWSSCDSRNAEIEAHVLDMLRPCEKLEELSINGYVSMVFPTWLGDTSFSNLVVLCFENCSNIISLPSVGQLPSLKKLKISNMPRIKRVGPEFYGNSCSKPFPSLEILCFREMPHWEDWTSHDIGQEVEGLPRLQELSIIDCPKLRGRLPKHLPSLKKLVIIRCEQLVVSVLTLSTRCWVEINGCKQVKRRSKVGLSVLPDISGHMILIESFMQSSSDVEEVEVVDYKEPTSFFHSRNVPVEDIWNRLGFRSELCEKLRYLIQENELKQRQVFPCRRQYLTLQNCVCLAKLPQALHNLSFLTKIVIARCPKIVSFPEATLPSCLRSIAVESCDALKYLPETWTGSTSVEYLSIHQCNSLTYIAGNQLSPHLKRLWINACDNLQGLMQEENNNLPATLEDIDISNCSSIVSLSSNGNLPKALKSLSIFSCPKLESIVERFDNNIDLETIRIGYCKNLRVLPQGELPSTNLKDLIIQCCETLEALPNRMNQLNHLQHIDISDCSSLVFFPEEGFPSSNLTSLVIRNCEKLEALPHHMHNLTSVRRLAIAKCPSIKSFSEDGFPTNLTSLLIADLKIFEPLFKWGLHRLTCLRDLHIQGCAEVDSFPLGETGVMLPTTLTMLKITDFPNLKCLSSSILSLNSLEELQLKDCPKLKSFPEKGLPLSLLHLLIHSNCPLLEQKCKENRGQYWPMIAHIPEIWINGVRQ